MRGWGGWGGWGGWWWGAIKYHYSKLKISLRDQADFIVKIVNIEKILLKQDLVVLKKVEKPGFDPTCCLSEDA